MRQRILLVALVVVLAGCGSTGGGGAAGGGAGASQGGNVGVAVGGAQDANAFRANIQNGYVPRPRAITHTGLFHDYYFDTGQSEPCSGLFCPSYSQAVSRDPLSNETEYFMTVGLNSGLSEAAFSRPDLNLVVVVDTSGSMSRRFGQYYQDSDGQRQQVESNERKIQAARSAVQTLTRHLRAGDEVGIVGFDETARTVVDMTNVSEANMQSVRTEIQQLQAGGGTDLEAGMDRARQLLSAADRQADEETRVIYVTDAMPNRGATSIGALRDRLEGDASNGIHTTFIGVGVDFNTELTDAITSVRGGNYYTINSPAQFSERMGEGFDYMVSPLVYNLSLRVQSDSFRIEHVYGTPSNDDTSRLMHVDTLFPSRREANRTEGGVILLELDRTSERTSGSVQLTASYETSRGEFRERTRTVRFGGHDPPYYQNTGVRKAVALSRYATLMQNWMNYQHARARGESVELDQEGIEYREPGRWERGSVDLRVTGAYGSRIAAFRQYFASEVEAIGDESMRQELAILDRLREQTTRTPSRTRRTVQRRQNRQGAASRSQDSGGSLLGQVSTIDVISLGVTVLFGTYGLRKRRDRGQ